MGCEDCRNEDRIAALERDRERNGDRHKEFNDRLSDLERVSTARDVKYDNIMELLDEVRDDLRELKEKPGRRWESLMGIVMQWAVLGLLAATMLFR